MKKKLLAFLLAACMLFSLCACGGGGNSTQTQAPATQAPATQQPENNPPDDNPATEPGTEEPGSDLPEITEFDPDASYIYKTSMSSMPSNWNPHTYQDADNSTPLDYTTDSLYTMIFNDESHPKEGHETPFDGYVIVPAMAAEMPVDVTESVKAEHPEFGIPESATSSYAWSVKLRDDLKFDDGTPITAETFVESLKRLLKPEAVNFRASDVYEGSYALANAKNYALSGQPTFVSFASQGTTYEDFIANGGTDEEVYVDMSGFWNVTGPDGVHGFGQITNDTMVRDPAVPEGEDEDYVSAKYLFDNYLGPNGGYHGSGYDTAYLGIIEYPYAENYGFENVGLYVSGDNELTFVFCNAMEGFFLTTYAMSTPYLVNIDLYDKCLSTVDTPGGGVAYTSTLCTSVDTSFSYGPYKISAFQTDKQMHFVKNDNWYGWTNDDYTYIDPDDGNRYRFYETTEIDIQHVTESSTSKQMFFAGQLMSYGLQADDYDQYLNSQYTYKTPAETVYFFLFNGLEKSIENREAAADFDQSKTDLQMQLVESFRRAVAVSIDRNLMAATVSPARSGAYALLGNLYIYDPDNVLYYRDTDQAKQVLVDFYSINLDDYNGDLDAAVNAITGYDPVAAKELFKEAYEEGLAKGYITDNDGDGKSDQTVTMTYAMSDAMSEFFEKTFAFLNDSVNKAAEGTGFEGKFQIVPSAPRGASGWADTLRNGTDDTAMAGWSGSVVDPFGITESSWTNTSSAYWGRWFDAEAYMMTINIDGEDITMSMRDWAHALNGTMVTVDGKDYNFGYLQTDTENRLTILASIERELMLQYLFFPVMENGGVSMLSQQVYYVVEDYVPMMGRGGIQYLKYNFSETEWADFVSSQGGTLNYA